MGGGGKEGLTELETHIYKAKIISQRFMNPNRNMSRHLISAKLLLLISCLGITQWVIMIPPFYKLIARLRK